MIKNLSFVAVIAAIVCSIACKKSTLPERIVLKETLPKVGSDEYYANLRAYKKTDHAIAFGWWGNSGGASGSDMSGRYIALPDSIDIVSLWAGFPINEAAWEELRYCQKVKGTRFVNVKFGSGVIATDSSFKDLIARDTMKAIEIMAKAISDTIDKHGLDGFDLDYEPGEASEVNTIFGRDFYDDQSGRNPYVVKLFEELGKYFGPKSGTGKLLIIDGYYNRGIEQYIDYYVQQAYSSNSAAALQSRFRTYGLGEVPAKKFVVTENMQQYGGFGAQFNYKGENIGSVTGMAMWNPVEGRKGGFGGYIIESDYFSKPNEPYYYIRKGIQIQNPAAYR